MRACIARVFSDIASRPVPSLRSRIWRISGHFERSENILEVIERIMGLGRVKVESSDAESLRSRAKAQIVR